MPLAQTAIMRGEIAAKFTFTQKGLPKRLRSVFMQNSLAVD
jgi:hypothetical protein